MNDHVFFSHAGLVVMLVLLMVVFPLARACLEAFIEYVEQHRATIALRRWCRAVAEFGRRVTR